MAETVYETHIMKDPLLPFIFHLDSIRHGPYQPLISNWHENIEILCCTYGRGYVQCDGKTYPFQKGDLFVVNANSLHSFGSEASLAYHCLIIDKTFCEENGIFSSDIYFRESVHDPEAEGLFHRIVETFSLRGNDPFAALQIRHAVLGLLCRLCRSHILSSKHPETSVTGQRVKDAITYIKLHICEPISLEDISLHIGISKCHLAREFKAYTGKTVFSTINLMRCAEAKRLIEQGNSVSSAALSSGFENLSYFSRTFKKHFGQLPSAYLPK